MKTTFIVIGFILMTTTAGQATGRYKCETVADDKWLTQEQIAQKLTGIGWQINRMKKDGGCWEVYGTTPDGLRVEGYFHPQTGEQLLLSQRGKEIFRKK
jgi:hypothetical protein